jgi:hypothetical protein
MQFSVVALIAVFAASASAVPTGVHFTRQGCDAKCTCPFCSTYFVGGVNDSVLTACAVALGPTAVSCVSAAVQEGVGMYCSALFMVFCSLSRLHNRPDLRCRLPGIRP